MPDNESSVQVSPESNDEPVKERSEGENKKSQVPEPQQNEDLLIEYVDNQNTLNCVLLHVPHDSHVEVAERDPWEHSGLLPSGSIEQVDQSSQPVPLVLVGLQEPIHEQKLETDIGEVEELGAEVHGRDEECRVGEVE